MPFPGVDFLEIDPLLNDDERLVRQTAREFVDREVLPIIEKHNREATFPMHLVPQMAELGFFGANLSGYGCAGMSNVAYGQVMQELERGDSGLRSFVSVQSALVMYPIHAFGSPAAEGKMAARAAQRQGHRLFRTDRAAIRLESRGHAYARRAPRRPLRAQRRENVDHQRLARRCRLVWAKAEDDTIRGFLVEKGTPGFKSWDVHGKLSLRASVTSGLSFTDCEIPAENLLPGVEGLRGPLSCLTQARYGIGWGAIGAAMACYQTALEYAKTRRQFENKPIAAHQLVQDKLVWMITEISKAQLLALHVGRLKDQRSRRARRTSPCSR